MRPITLSAFATYWAYCGSCRRMMGEHIGIYQFCPRCAVPIKEGYNAFNDVSQGRLISWNTPDFQMLPDRLPEFLRQEWLPYGDGEKEKHLLPDTVNVQG
jgi:hypothetical protein